VLEHEPQPEEKKKASRSAVTESWREVFINMLDELFCDASSMKDATVLRMARAVVVETPLAQQKVEDAAELTIAVIVLNRLREDVSFAQRFLRDLFDL